MNAARSPAERATYRAAFAIGEFRVLWLATLLSLIGDNLARVALSVLVFQRTASPLLTATVYAMTFLPWVIGGPVLAGLLNPRRSRARHAVRFRAPARPSEGRRASRRDDSPAAGWPIATRGGR